MDSFKKVFVPVLFAALLGVARLSPALVRPQGAMRPPSAKMASAYLATPIMVTLNPYGIAPLAALAEFTTAVPCSVIVDVQGEIPVGKLFEDDGTDHAVPIVGLYAGRTNTVTLTIFSHHGTPEVQTLSIATAPLPDPFPTITIDTANIPLMEPGFNVCDFGYTTGTGILVHPYVFDARGEVRAYFDLSGTPGQAFPFERLSNGNFVYGVGNAVYEIDIMGRMRNKLTVPNNTFHHDIKEMPDGSLIAAVNRAGTRIVNSTGVHNSQEDRMIQIDRKTGAILGDWDLRPLLDVSRNEVINAVGDWFHMNGIWYSAADDGFIMSGRHQGIVKVTRDNKLKWILAANNDWAHSGWDNAGPSPAPYLLTAVDAEGAPYDDVVQTGMAIAPDFDWTWGQHDPHLLPNGDLICFDNGFRRLFTDVGPFYSRHVEYVIDEKAMTVRQVWQYGLERGMDLYSTIISSVDRLPLTGNRLIAPGIVQLPTESYSKIVEMAYPSGQVVFEATSHFKNLLSTTGANGGFDLTYRTRRIPSLYP